MQEVFLKTRSGQGVSMKLFSSWLTCGLVVFVVTLKFRNKHQLVWHRSYVICYFFYRKAEYFLSLVQILLFKHFP